MKTEQEIKEKIKEVATELENAKEFEEIELNKMVINILLWVLD